MSDVSSIFRWNFSAITFVPLIRCLLRMYPFNEEEEVVKRRHIQDINGLKVIQTMYVKCEINKNVHKLRLKIYFLGKSVVDTQTHWMVQLNISQGQITTIDSRSANWLHIWWFPTACSAEYVLLDFLNIHIALPDK